MSTAQKIWDSAHPVKIGQTLQPGTEIVKVEHRDIFGWIHEVNLGIIEENELLEITDDYMEAFVRTIKPLPSSEDTGELVVEVDSQDGEIQLYDAFNDHAYDLDANQARNLARKLTEALDG